MNETPLPPLIVLSGPSGAGKTTVVDALLLEGRWPLRRGITATSRAARPGEVAERDYHFWSVDRFQKAIESGEMLEHAFVHTDYYGTPRSEVDPWRAKGIGVILVIDVQGAEHVRELYPNDHSSIFLTVPAKGTLRDRLEFRGDSEEKIQTRLRTAEAELLRIGEFDHVVVNDDLPTARALAPHNRTAVSYLKEFAMLEDLKEEEIVNKVGGRFKLSALIQKRMVALNTGAKPLVHVPGGDKMAIVIEEIMQDKIYLDVSGDVQSRNATSMANITGTTLGSMGPATIPIGGGRSGEND